VKEELIALVMRRKQLEPEESVKNGEYYGKWSMWVKGQVPESLRPQAGAVLAGGKISPVAPVSTGQKTIKNSIGMELVLIPAGSFQMGSNEGSSDEKPVHQVTIAQAFCMGKTEVTQAQWKAVMGNNPSYFKGDDLPVEQVSWQDAKAFIQKLNAKENTDKYRLPSEAEWEYAARAGSTTKWHFGNDESLLGDYAWYDGNSGGKTHAVAGKKPNKYGLYDMAGNVWEWNEDGWESNYNTPRTQSPYENSSENRLLRGGSWNNDANGCRSAYRDYGSYRRYGFRVVSFPSC
jgi:formylglycine-generating enzyme required for sulfatase activity